SVNFSVRSITCMPSCSVANCAIESRSATHSATWSRVFKGTRPRYRCDSLLLRGDRPLQLRLVHLRAALDAETLRLVVELLLRPPLPVPARGAAGRAPA